MGFLDKLRSMVGGNRSNTAEPPSPRDLFRAEVEAQIHENPTVDSVTPRDHDYGLDVALKGGGSHTVYLENTFLETREASPDQRRERIRKLVSSIGSEEPDLDWDAAKERLVPLVRACTLFVGIDDKNLKMPIRRPFAPFLIETVALDSDDSFRYVTPDMVEGWGVPPEDAFAAAHETAAACFSDEDIEPYDPESAFPLWHVAHDDGYETSRLAVPGWLASFDGRVVGRPVAIIPQRSILIVGGDGDERCIKRLIDIAEREYEASPRTISTALYTIDDSGGVVPLVLPADHPLANAVVLGHLRLAIAEYESGKDALQKEVGEDVFVASFVGIQRGDGRVTSYTVWTQGVPSILPRAAEIALVEAVDAEAENVFRVPWEEVERLGLLEALPDLDPPRWRTRDWPSRAVLKQLRKVAVA